MPCHYRDALTRPRGVHGSLGGRSPLGGSVRAYRVWSTISVASSIGQDTLPAFVAHFLDSLRLLHHLELSTSARV
jgi:hypothetical protein